MRTALPEQTPLRLLGVYAHPDDESFCAGGTLAKYAAAGADIMVVSMTQGEAGQIRNAQAATRRTLGQTRAQELQRACQELGVQHVLCLDYGDGKLKELEPRTLVGKVTEIIRTFRPDVVLTFGEDGVYGHPDHIAVGAATDAAFALAGDPEQFPEQLAAGLSPHTPGRLYHSYFPRNRHLLMDHLVRWLTGCDTRFQGTLDFVHGLVFMADETTTLGYSSDHVDVRWYPPGFYILEQGEPATSLYLILSGQADVMCDNPDGSLHQLAVIGPGAFFGEEGLADNRQRNTYIIARDSVTCLVLSPGEPTAFAGRGQEARFAVHPGQASAERVAATTRIDVSAYVHCKMAAVAAHRTQCPITADLFPETIVRELFAHEYFVRIYPRMEMETELCPTAPMRDHTPSNATTRFASEALRYAAMTYAGAAEGDFLLSTMTSVRG
jgi:LmbE family N-acetylglucosaminyl deacetylase